MKNNIAKFAVLACVACFALSSQSEAAPHGAPGFGKPAPHAAMPIKPGDRLDAKQMQRAAMEKARLEKERLEKARLEKERMERARLEKERLEKARLEKERMERARLEKERLRNHKPVMPGRR